MCNWQNCCTLIYPDTDMCCMYSVATDHSQTGHTQYAHLGRVLTSVLYTVLQFNMCGGYAYLTSFYAYSIQLYNCIVWNYFLLLLLIQSKTYKDMQWRIFNRLEESWWRTQALHLPAVRHCISMCVNINIIISCSRVKLRSRFSCGHCHGTLYYVIVLHTHHNQRTHTSQSTQMQQIESRSVCLILHNDIHCKLHYSDINLQWQQIKWPDAH